jgi:hypothetical protein
MAFALLMRNSISALEDRDWGQRVAYSLDPDGHVLAFAEIIESESEPA